MRRALFVPVSGGHGGGEVQRSLMLARRLRQRAGAAVDVRFLLSAAAAFPRDEFDTVALPASPTRSEPEVAAAIAAFAPHVCVFDSTLRMSALRAARAAGSRTVYLSVRPNSRWRGLDPRKRGLLDEHWLIAPERLGAGATWQERLGRRLLPGTRFHYFGVVAELPDREAAGQLRHVHGLEPDRYVLVCPGGAGYRIDGLAPIPFLAAAGADVPVSLSVVVIDAGRQTLPPGWIGLPRMPNAVLMALVADARLNIVNGGSLLVQALAQGAACLAVPMQQEQADRIAAFTARGAVLSCAPDRRSVTQAWSAALAHPDVIDTLRRRARALPLRNDLDELVGRITGLLG